MKRIFDILFSLVALAVFCIPCTLIILVIILREKHKILFKQKRLGKDKTDFEILKFQTLVKDVPTKTGRVLRRTGLDEIPQFINVLKGDMSIVGPRALTQNESKRLNWDDKFHAIRWSVKPGIAGYAQIYGGQHKKTSWFWDKRYIQSNNILSDFCILIVAFGMNIFGKTKVRRIIFNDNSLR